MTGPSLTVTALTFNAHLFGHGAEFFVNGARRETGFYFHDAERLPQIIDAVRGVDADLVGFTEIWDGNDQELIRNELRDVYPYSAVSPAAPGIGRVIEKTYGDWPRLGRVLFGSSRSGAEDGVVSVFTRRHYSVGKTGLVTGRNALVSEDLIGQAISSLLRSAPVWGAGLVFLSKYPIESSCFLRHPLKADWERMADKGVLWSTVRLPNGRRARVCLAHYQEGETPQALAARRDQIRRTRRTADFLDDPVIALGDFNVVGGTLEHAWMLSTLTLIDSGREPTYRDPNPYQKKLSAPVGQKAEARRLDYILHTEDWTAVESAVLRDSFQAREGYSLSDHDPVFARFHI
ncbi:MAG TPA: endonuclease/exonuclease/phosphatase family protein [bacterium]|nr:endonuclease/exonuclease/phosphatase family protein [bacterium]